jgi:prevent-host-death family protein
MFAPGWLAGEKRMKTTDWIVTASDLQANPGVVLKNAKQRPLIVTEGGRPSAYVVSVELFDRLLDYLLELERSQLVTNLAEGERQFAASQFVTLQEAVAAAEEKWQAQESGA